jgi:hypothetical protein
MRPEREEGLPGRHESASDNWALPGDRHVMHMAFAQPAPVIRTKRARSCISAMVRDPV